MISEPGSDCLNIIDTAEGVIFSVHVQPRASRNEIVGLHGTELKLRLTSPPVDDAANRLCIEFLAKNLGVAKSRVSINSGYKSRHKTVLVQGVTSAAVIALIRTTSHNSRN
jgi:uncharacterized protein (TIGR00251 family)